VSNSKIASVQLLIPFSQYEALAEVAPAIADHVHVAGTYTYRVTMRDAPGALVALCICRCK
jgi:hypothetical protein